MTRPPNRAGPEQLLRTFVEAIAARDFARVRACLADDGFSHRSPIAAHANPDSYVADISRIGAILESVRVRRIFVDGNEVCAVVEYVTRMDRRTATSVVHWMTLRRDRIASIETFFDATEYAKLFAVE